MALESNVYALWCSKQVAKGTPNASATKRLIQVAGDLEVQRADGAEAFSDLDRFGNQTDFANTLMGAGSPGIEAQSDVLAYLCWLMFGGETFTVGTPPSQILHAGTATGGAFNLTVGVGGTASIVHAVSTTVTAAALQTLLNALPDVTAAGGVTCTGGPLPTATITITFSHVTPLGMTLFSIDSTAVTGGTGPHMTMGTAAVMPTHVFTPQVGGGFWSTFYKRVGNTVIQRQQFADCRFNTFAIEGSTAAKVVRVTPSIMSLLAGTLMAADPTLPINLANVPFLYTDGQGTFTIDGVVFQGQTQFNVTWDEGLAPAYGDATVAFDLVPALAQITVAATLVVDALGMTEFNEIIYGSGSPTPGTPPLQNLPAMGSWSCDLTRPTGEELAITVPGVHWNPGLSIPPNPQGGVIDLSLAGQMRKVQGLPASTVAVACPDNAAYTV